MLRAALLLFVACIAFPAAAQVDTAPLLGKWQRTEGGYVIDIRGASTEGKLDAAYFNPNPINVSQAAWRRGAKNTIEIFVELRDKGYPGATYRLMYRASDDSLVGTYTQPAVDQTFPVKFTRQQK